ncbi:MAG: L-histidine N(alpha)-methyltransferase [Candidatus Marinimicrobia bacterium]|nr:L-histidine N(alpha)-methyltransferase [Candidatus Neomarinimicrobiota bacterium]MCF7827602.1 L-histidine N(alpha)-methyltransferase [Candidatus Neomarinimicrobiota bacterium]MCF7881537.1 L-histidine N(alpha)-methyltransferase [Candidatus Neomarinimicrobiota bacterium]
MSAPVATATNQIEITAANHPGDSFAEDIRDGLTRDPKVLFPKYLYDERGSELFARICTLPEYYQTRTERKILAEISKELIEQHQPVTLVEYGAGAATKTKILLDAMRDANLLHRYVPIDVSAEFLRRAAGSLAEDYPGMQIHGLTGDFLEPIELPHSDEPRLIAFLGSTIGNLTDSEADEFFAMITDQMTPKDRFLLGIDLVKDVNILERAYNDSQGVTAAFNKNILQIINRRMSADFNSDTFQHHAFYNPWEAQIEIHLISREKQVVHISELEMEVSFRKGESIRTEISCKYTRERVEHLLVHAGLEPLEWFTDDREYFGLSLSRLSG